MWCKSVSIDIFADTNVAEIFATEGECLPFHVWLLAGKLEKQMQCTCTTGYYWSVGVVIFQCRFKGIQFASRANSSYLWPSSGAKQAVYTATYQKKTEVYMYMCIFLTWSIVRGCVSGCRALSVAHVSGFHPIYVVYNIHGSIYFQTLIWVHEMNG